MKVTAQQQEEIQNICHAAILAGVEMFRVALVKHFESMADTSLVQGDDFNHEGTPTYDAFRRAAEVVKTFKAAR